VRLPAALRDCAEDLLGEALLRGEAERAADCVAVLGGRGERELEVDASCVGVALEERVGSREAVAVGPCCVGLPAPDLLARREGEAEALAEREGDAEGLLEEARVAGALPVPARLAVPMPETLRVWVAGEDALHSQWRGGWQWQRE
jgi:hypothetical protein